MLEICNGPLEAISLARSSMSVLLELLDNSIPLRGDTGHRALGTDRPPRAHRVRPTTPLAFHRAWYLLERL